MEMNVWSLKVLFVYMVGLIIDNTLSMVLCLKEHPGFVLFKYTHIHIFNSTQVMLHNTVMQILWKEIVKQYSYHFYEVIRFSTHVASCCIYLLFTSKNKLPARFWKLSSLLCQLEATSTLNCQYSTFPTSPCIV